MIREERQNGDCFHGRPVRDPVISSKRGVFADVILMQSSLDNKSLHCLI